MDILISVAAKIAEYTVAPIGRQVGYLIFYKDNFDELKDQVKELEGAKEHIKHDIEVERRNGKDIEAVVQNWLNKVDEITEAANKLSEDPHRANVGCSRWSFPNLKSRHQLSRKAKKIAKNIAEVGEKRKFERIGYLPPVDVVSIASTARGSEKLLSRNRMKEDIVLALKDPTLSKIGVYGLSGVGKTTIVKEVAKQVKDDKLFDTVIVADVNQTLDLKRIQDEIAEQLGLHFEEKTSLVRASRLHERIKKEQTILIILDDIWENFDLEKIGISLDDKQKGCKILLTSRMQDTLQNMETQKNFRLEVLNREETWCLFEVMVGDAIKDANLHSIANQVAAKCGGLPVLVVTVARALKNKDIYCWKDALNKLEIVGDGGLNEIAYSVLEFSYKQLESNEVKSLFLLCGILGKSPLISDLLKYGIGLGIFKNVNTMEDARNKFHSMISDLKASCLLLEVDTSKRVRMHDIVCEVATAIASRDQYVFTLKKNAQLKDWPTEDFLRRCTQINLYRCYTQILPERLNCPNLKLFYFNSSTNRSLKIPHSFFEGMRNLEVLNLTGMIISSFPTSLAFLTKLKTLCLDKCVLGDMVGIGSLKNLKILSLWKSSMIELPSEIGQLIHLRMLDLSNTGFEIVPSNVISNLTELEELYMGNTSIKWELQNSVMENENVSLAELKHLKNLTALQIQILEAWMLPRNIMFEKLERYKIIIGDIWEWFEKHEAPRLLKLKLKTNIHLEHGIKTLIKRVEDLYLDEINGISNVLYHLNGEGFPLLKHLHIQNNVELQHIVNSRERNRTHIFFPKLETLVLHNLRNLEKICHGSLTGNSFGKLRVIKVKHCCQIEYLFSISMIKELSQLLEIEVSECNSMKNIVSMENMDNGKTTDKIEFIQLCSLTLQHLPRIDNFYSSDFISSTIEVKSEPLRTNIKTSFFNVKLACPNLETLKLSAINFSKIWDDDQLCLASSFQNLANLIIEDCGSLKYLFSSSMVESFKNLKRLEIKNCNMMKEIIATKERNDGDPSEEVRFSKLEKIIINDMKNLRTAWHYQFQGLKTLEVSKCEKLENIFPSCSTQKALGSLERLKISDCALVEEIFKMNANTLKCPHQEKDEDTAQLRTLILVELPKLKQIWSKDSQGTLCFYNLQTMQIKYCHNLEYLFPFFIAKDLSQLEDLTVISCQGIKVIVSKKDGATEKTTLFELNHLASLDLQNLLQLRGFYAGAHILKCQSLKKIIVLNCKQLKLFNVKSNRSQEMALIDQLHFPILQPLFTVEEVIGNLEKLTLNYADANMILQHQVPWDLFCKLKLLRISEFEDDEAAFPHLFIENVPNLEILVVEWSSFREIFYDQTIRGEGGGNQPSTWLKEMYLYSLPKLQHICKEGSQIHPILQVLEKLTMLQCSSLRNLVPSSFTFCQLTYLDIEDCNGFINVITSLTARSLVKLETMKLKRCNSLEEIVTEEEDDTKSEIAFSSLKILELECLPKLNIFSSSKCFLKFPLLEKAVVRECPRMEIFSVKRASSPMLRKVLIEEKDEQWCWEGDLSRTIKKIFIDKIAFHSFKHLELSKYPELKELWYNPIGHKPFSNLKSMVVQECYWLSNVLLPLNMLQALSILEVLEVRNCDSLEAVFDLGGMNESEVVVKETIQLKKIIVANLPSLKHIWKQDTQEIVSFDNLRDEHVDDGPQQLKMFEASSVDIESKDPPTYVEKTRSGVHQKKVGFYNLQVLIVEHCKELEYLFPFHIAMDLLYLEKIRVASCGIKEIVANKERTTNVAATFVFKHLSSLELCNLEELERFYAGNYSLACPSLKATDVFNCNKLELFRTLFMNSQERGVMGDGNSMAIGQSTEQPLLKVDEVIPNLEELTLNIKVANMILQGQYSRKLFTKLKLLRVTKFEDEQIIFPNWFLENAPCLETLVVYSSSFKQVFQDDRVASNQGNNNVHTKLKKLSLIKLPELQHICKEGNQIDPILDFLEILFVIYCSNLKHLVPSSARFGYLNYLEIQKCDGLTDLISPPTARSLVNLTVIKIIKCSSLEQIVTKEGDETTDEIAFESLKHLELTCLSSFNSFSSGKHKLVFSSLGKLKIIECPRLQNFTSGVIVAPMLTIVEFQNGTKRWRGDLNTTINQQFIKKQEVADSD